MEAIVAGQAISFDRVEGLAVGAHFNACSILHEVPFEACDTFASVVVLLAVYVVAS